MEGYRNYADYIIKKAMDDLLSLEQFLRYVFFEDSLWQSRLLGQKKEKVKEFEGILHRANLNKYLKQEFLDKKVFFQNVDIIIEAESSIRQEDIYQLLRQEAAVFKPKQKRKPLIAMIISLTDSAIHWSDGRPCAFLEVINILGPKTFIGFAAVNLYLIELEFYELYFKDLFNNWNRSEVEKILDNSFSSLLFSYCVRSLWLKREQDKSAWQRMEALKFFLDKLWDEAQYSSIFYEGFWLFRKDLPELVNYFDEGDMRMKSFIETMPEGLREIYEEVLVKPIILEKERAEKEKERAEKERAEKELKMTCQEMVADKFPDISGKALISINKLSFSECNQALKALSKIDGAKEYEAFLVRLSNK